MLVHLFSHHILVKFNYKLENFVLEEDKIKENDVSLWLVNHEFPSCRNSFQVLKGKLQDSSNLLAINCFRRGSRLSIEVLDSDLLNILRSKKWKILHKFEK